jgi:glycosyltransferase involved in cell wall biosynthesis
MSHRARIGAFFKFALGAARRAATLQADVVFATSTPLTIALPAAYVARRKRIPMVLEVRDLWPELPIAIGALRNPISKWAAHCLERFAYRNAARIVALSPGMAQGAIRAGYCAQRVTVVPNGSDLDFFRRDPVRGRQFRQGLGISDSQILVGYAGTLGRMNAVGFLVRIAAALRNDRRFAFVVMGDGQEREAITALGRQHAVLGENFHMLPAVPKAQMPAALSAFDVATSLFLPIPEMEANSANKFFDALAAGCCVAINYGGWQAALLKEAGAGIQLAADPSHAAQDLIALASDPSRIRSSGCNARLLAEREFSRDDLAARVEAVIADAVAQASKRPPP